MGPKWAENGQKLFLKIEFFRPSCTPLRDPYGELASGGKAAGVQGEGCGRAGLHGRPVWREFIAYGEKEGLKNSIFRKSFGPLFAPFGPTIDPLEATDGLVYVL